MEKTTKTFAQIRAFNIGVQGFARRKPTNLSTKLGYALKKVSDGSVTKAVKEYQSAYQEAYYTHVETVQVDNSLTDQTTGAILSAEKGSDRPYLYDKEGLKAVMMAERNFNDKIAPAILAEWDLKEYEIDTYFASELPDDLTEEEVEAFRGFSIREDEVYEPKKADEAKAPEAPVAQKEPDATVAETLPA